MKKIGDLFKPFASVVFGALLLFYYLDFLRMTGTALVLGIFALIISIYYIGIGIVGIILGEKFPSQTKRVFDVISIALFPLFVFIYYIIMCTSGANYGPTGWIIVILSMNASMLFCALYVVAAFAKVPVLKRLAQLFAAIFVLALLVNVLYTFGSGANPLGWAYLGEIDVMLVVLYSLYTFMLINALKEPAQE